MKFVEKKKKKKRKIITLPSLSQIKFPQEMKKFFFGSYR